MSLPSLDVESPKKIYFLIKQAARDASLAYFVLDPALSAQWRGWVLLTLRFSSTPAPPSVAPVIEIRSPGMPGVFDATVLCSRIARNRSAAVFKLYGVPCQLRVLFPVDELEEGCQVWATVEPVSALEAGWNLIRKQSGFSKYSNLKKLISKALRAALRGGRSAMKTAAREVLENSSYSQYYGRWLDFFDPGFSVAQSYPLVPELRFLILLMDDPQFSEEALLASIASVQAQSYPNWRLILFSERIQRQTLKNFSADIRIEILPRQDSVDTVDVSDTFVTILHCGDHFSRSALAHFGNAISAEPGAEILYSDEDQIDSLGRRSSPNFKPAWNLDYFRSQNLISQAAVYRRLLFERMGGVRFEKGRAWEYELAARAVLHCEDEKIIHVPLILYHRFHSNSLVVNRRPERSNSEEKSVLAALAKLTAYLGPDYQLSRGMKDGFHIEFIGEYPPVSGIICTRDRVELLRDVVDGLSRLTDYPKLEILVVDNQSRDPLTISYLQEIQSTGRARIIPFTAPFNFSAMNNLAVLEATHSVVAFLNNDLQMISRSWLKEMVCHCIRTEVGAVGAKLYFGNGSIQHAGVALGLGFGAGHPKRCFPPEDRDSWGRLFAVQRVSAVTAACMVLRKSVFWEAGGFDAEAFGVAFNDVDLCLKIQSRGYSVIWTPYAELVHLESASRGADIDEKKLARLKGEADLLRKTWGNLFSGDPYYHPCLALDSESWLPSFPPRSTAARRGPQTRRRLSD